jgi:hypothetical protein
MSLPSTLALQRANPLLRALKLIHERRDRPAVRGSLERRDMTFLLQDEARTLQALIEAAIARTARRQLSLERRYPFVLFLAFRCCRLEPVRQVGADAFEAGWVVACCFGRLAMVRERGESEW